MVLESRLSDPTSHTFSLDSCVFACQGLTNPLGKPVCSFDPEGLIFAAGVESQTIKLYDLRAYDKVKYSVIVFCASMPVLDKPFTEPFLSTGSLCLVRDEV